MKISRRAALTSAMAATTGRAWSATPGTGPTLRIGLINDQSSAYRDNGGPGSVACAKQAIADHADRLGLKVEMMVADHQNKADVGLTIARQWFDQGVDVLADIQGSAVGLALSGLAKERDKVILICNAAVTDLTGSACNANTTHWGYDAYMLARTLSEPVVKSGGDTWWFIVADYAFGHSVENNMTPLIKKAGGRVLGSTAMPFPSSDYAAALLQAKVSGAKIIAIANGGTDLESCIKQAGEFGITNNGTKLVAPLIFVNNIHSLGLQSAHGLLAATTFYWDMNDRTRAFTKRVTPLMAPGLLPNMSQAANYSSVAHYLKAAASLGADQAKASGSAVVARMKAMPVDDDVLGSATVREDGCVASATYLMEVKQPAESKYPWDYYKNLATVPAADAWKPLAETGCPLVKT